jgi:hypothetical protein
MLRGSFLLVYDRLTAVVFAMHFPLNHGFVLVFDNALERRLLSSEVNYPVATC